MRMTSKHAKPTTVLVVEDEPTVRTLAELLQTSDIQDDIHRALWKVSRQANVSVFMTNGP